MKKILVFALFCSLLYSQNIENDLLLSDQNNSEAATINQDKFAVLSEENLENNLSQSEDSKLQLDTLKQNEEVSTLEENLNSELNKHQNSQNSNLEYQEQSQNNYGFNKQNQQVQQANFTSANKQENAYQNNTNQANQQYYSQQNYQNSQNYNQNQPNNYNQGNPQYQQVGQNYNQGNQANPQNYNQQNSQQNYNQNQASYNQGNNQPNNYNQQYQQQGNSPQNYNQANQNYQNVQNNPQYQNYPQNYNQNQGNCNNGNAYQNNANQAQQQYYNQQNHGNQVSQQHYQNQQEINQVANYDQGAYNWPNQVNSQNYNQTNQAQAVNIQEKAKSNFKITDIDLIAIAKFIVGAFLLGIIFIVFKNGKKILVAVVWPFKKMWNFSKKITEFSSFVVKKIIIEYPTRAFNAVIIEPAKAIGDFSVKAFNATKDGLSSLGNGFVNLFKGESQARTNFTMDIVSMKSLGELNAYQIKNKMSVDHEAEAFQDFSTLSKIFSNKKMIIDFDFDLHFIYDLNDPNFQMEQIKPNEFNIKMPTCKYRYSVKNINIHSEESSKLKILPNLKFGLISKGFSHEEKNALVKEAMNKNEMDLIRKEIEATKANIQESAIKSITNLARSFGNKNIKLNFEFNDTELLNADALEMEMIEDKKQSDKMSNVIEVEQLTKKED